MKQIRSLFSLCMMVLLLSIAVVPIKAQPSDTPKATVRNAFTNQGLITDLSQPASLVNQEFKLFFPVVQRRQGLEAVITHTWGDSSYFRAIGYIQNLSDSPVYSVTVDVQFVMYSSFEPPGDTYTQTIQVTPALTATLLGQFDPFYFYQDTYKTSVQSFSILGVSAVPLENGVLYYPLTVVSFNYASTDLTGTVRNDSIHPLYHIRVVVLEPKGTCFWKEAIVDTNSLLPGQETTFHLASACLSDNLIIVAQGADSP